jgi:HEAT repeat protein
VATALLARYREERIPAVQSRIVAGLGHAAQGGSEEALKAVLSAFEELSTEVKLAATSAMSRIADPRALQQLLRQLAAEMPALRLATVQTLRSYDSLLRPHVALLQTALSVESDARVRAALQGLIGRIK